MSELASALEASLAHLSDQADPGLPDEIHPSLLEYDHYAGETHEARRLPVGRRYYDCWFVHDTEPGMWVLVQKLPVDGAIRMVCGCPEGQAIVEAFEDGRYLDHCWHLRAVMDELDRRQASSRNRPSAPVNPGLYE